MKWYLNVLQNKYAAFNGRSPRIEFWNFVLINTIICIVLALIGQVIDFLSILSIIYGLAVLVPGVALAFRRIHDTDRSAWWLLVGFIPIVGFLVVLYFYIQPGTPGPNRFGPDPLVSGAAPAELPGV